MWPGGFLVVRENRFHVECRRSRRPVTPTRCSRATSAGAEVLTAVYETDYGSREFVVSDPEGNRWSFGTYRGESRKH